MIKITNKNWKKEYFTILIFTTLQIFTKSQPKFNSNMPCSGAKTVGFGQIIIHTNYDSSLKASKKTTKSNIPPLAK